MNTLTDRYRAYVVDGLRQVLDLLQPRALIIGLLRGTWVLLCLLIDLGRAGLRKATSSPAPAASAPPARKGPPPKVRISKEDGPPPEEGQGGGEEAGEEPPAAAPKVKAGQAAEAVRAAGDWLQNAALTLLVLIVAGGSLSSIAGGLLYLLRPYATIVTAVLTAAWAVAALIADAIARPVNDHEEDAGEEVPEVTAEGEAEAPQEAEQVDPWPATRELLRTFVEHRVTAGASGLKEGVKGRGARVDDLLSEQQENGGLIGYDRKAFIRLLDRAGITVRTQMKFRVAEGAKWDERNVPGVHITDLADNLGRNPRMPAHLVPDNALGAPPVLPEKSPQNVIPIPLARAAGE